MLEEQVIAKLREHQLKITTAESCTGGLIAATLVNVAGASYVLDEGYITYSNDAKRKLLGVKEESLRQYGAVSRQVAEQMAEGAAKSAGADAALAATGIAGPGGGSEEKPVGLVYIGCYLKGKTVVKKYCFQGSRTEVRRQTVETALELLLDCMEQAFDRVCVEKEKYEQ